MNRQRAWYLLGALLLVGFAGFSLRVVPQNADSLRLLSRRRMRARPRGAGRRRARPRAPRRYDEAAVRAALHARRPGSSGNRPCACATTASSRPTSRTRSASWRSAATTPAATEFAAEQAAGQVPEQVPGRRSRRPTAEGPMTLLSRTLYLPGAAGALVRRSSSPSPRSGATPRSLRGDEAAPRRSRAAPTASSPRRSCSPRRCCSSACWPARLPHRVRLPVLGHRPARSTTSSPPSGRARRGAS